MSAVAHFVSLSCGAVTRGYVRPARHLDVPGYGSERLGAEIIVCKVQEAHPH